MKFDICLVFALVPLLIEASILQTTSKKSSAPMKTESESRTFSYMAWLNVKRRVYVLVTKEHGCSGTIISKNWILTAAQCVER